MNTSQISHNLKRCRKHYENLAFLLVLCSDLSRSTDLFSRAKASVDVCHVSRTSRFIHEFCIHCTLSDFGLIEIPTYPPQPTVKTYL